MKSFAVPEFARDLRMFLVEGLTIVRVDALADFRVPSAAHFLKPIRIRERLARKAHDVGLLRFEQTFCLSESMDAAADDDRSFTAH